MTGRDRKRKREANKEVRENEGRIKKVGNRKKERGEQGGKKE